jgi:N-acyl-D-amino-acid deacylase
MRRVAEESGLPVTFSIVPGRSDKAKAFWVELMDLVEAWNASGKGPKMHAQFAPRPVGMLASFDLTSNPWADCPTYKKLAHLPIEARVRELAKPEVKHDPVRNAGRGGDSAHRADPQQLPRHVRGLSRSEV